MTTKVWQIVNKKYCLRHWLAEAPSQNSNECIQCLCLETRHLTPPNSVKRKKAMTAILCGGKVLTILDPLPSLEISFIKYFQVSSNPLWSEQYQYTGTFKDLRRLFLFDRVWLFVFSTNIFLAAIFHRMFCLWPLKQHFAGHD